MITAESRDFSVATYSEVSCTGTALASITFTGIAGGPPAGAVWAEFFEHASPTLIPDKTATSKLFENS
jgi:hypothetical protein